MILDDNSRIDRTMLWRTSMGPENEIDLWVDGPRGIIPTTIRHTIGQDWTIDSDPVRLPPIILRTNTAIFTDEDAVRERKIIFLNDDRAYTVQFKLYSGGKMIAESHIYFLYVPAVQRGNEGFTLFDYAKHN